jgi:2-dehydropantoate 2-reductase
VQFICQGKQDLLFVRTQVFVTLKLAMPSPTQRARPSVAIYGAGAIGLTLASELITAGHAVTVVARGKSYEQISAQGIELRFPDRPTSRHSPSTFNCVNSSSGRGAAQSHIFITVKSQDTLDACTSLSKLSLLADDTHVIIAANGVPFWLSYKQPKIESLLPNTDNRDKLFASVPANKIIGGVISFNASLLEPGVVQLNAGNTITLGEISDNNSGRIAALQALFTQGKISVKQSANIRRDVWHKLLVNISINPASVVYQKPIDELIGTKESRQVIAGVMREVHALGVILGVCEEGDFNIEAFLTTFAEQRKGSFTSMYNDHRASRPLEFDRIIGTVLYLASLPKINLLVPNLTLLSQHLDQRCSRADN